MQEISRQNCRQNKIFTGFTTHGVIGNQAIDEPEKVLVVKRITNVYILESSLKVLFNEIDRHFHPKENTNWMELTTIRISPGTAVRGQNSF